MTYAGDVTAQAAYAGLDADRTAVIVDCRTQAEWMFVGTPAVDRVLFVEWQRFPDGRRNDAFLQQLAEAGVDPTAPVFFLCRSGQRSRHAAIEATAAGYRSAYNVSGGFEGDLDAAGRRGTNDGWKAAGLPWRQT
jgi:rhodanese-related sulfurtransferase